MKKTFLRLFGLVGLILLLAGCGNEEVKPVEINESTDTCEVCNMMVANDQHVTQIALESGRTLVFDDLGCMYEWLDGHAEEKIAAEFVRDYHNKEWVLVDEATFVYNQSVKTPMAYNVISFKDKQTAEEFAAEHEGSTVMTATELAEHSWKRNQEMMMKNKMEHHSHDQAEGMDHSGETENDDPQTEESDSSHGEDTH